MIGDIGFTDTDASKWDFRFLHLAAHIARWSKDPSTKCGAVIVRPNRTIASVGYNGFPRGTSDDEAKYAHRPTKYSRVVHAEVNAILNCDVRPEGMTLYTYSNGWGPCCDRCATCIIQSGITRIVYDEAPIIDRALDAINSATQMLNEVGIEWRGIKL